uniref:Disease resistance N-terminal domain-containing protein n=1 Tax=Fagus sylvatica TaxID=28930 RepID=A0A2N9I7A6_FAGSY
MAEGALFDVANGIIGKLGNLALQEILLIWGVKDEIRKFMETVSTIRAVLLDAEAKQHNNEVKVWLERLKDAMFDADDLLDDISTEALRREVMTRNKNKAKEVRNFFSTSNQLAYGLKMGHKVKAMRERLDEIAVDKNKFHLEERSEERQVRFKAREQTYSVVRADDVIGREDDKEPIIGSLLNPNVEEDVSILPISWNRRTRENHMAFVEGEEPKNITRFVEIGKEILKKSVGIPLAIRTIGFAVGSVARINGGLKELQELNKLSGNLKIVNLRHGKDAALESKYIDNSEEGLSDSSFHPSLEELSIEDCPNLKGWWRGRRDSVEEIGITTPITSNPLNYSFPRLSKLDIWNCPQLTYMPLFPYLEHLTLCKCSLKPLEQTMRMGMINMTASPSISSSSSILSFAPLSKLNYMWIQDMDKALSEELLRNLISLRALYLIKCPLPPQGMRYLTTLQSLYVWKSEVVDLSNDWDKMEWQGLRSLLSLQFYELPKLVSLPSWASTPHLFADIGDLGLPQFDVVAGVDRWAYIFADTGDFEVSHIIGKMQKGNRRGLA